MRVLLLRVGDLHREQVRHEGVVQLGLVALDGRNYEGQRVEHLVADDVLALRDGGNI
jgi:hypothetical protein